MPEIRIDRMPLPAVRTTAEGYLRGEATVTRTGVFVYVNADGTLRRELRHPDDVLNTDSLETLKMIPITVDHPAGLVDSENVEGLTVGQTGETVRVDGSNVQVSLNVTNKRGISAIRNDGHEELSLGYRLDLEEEVGVFNGEPYTHRQRNVQYNHLALVRRGRAGREARLNLDGAAVQLDEKEETMKKVTINGVQYDAADEVAIALDAANAQIAQLQTKVDQQAARADAATEQVTALTTEVATLKTANSDAAIEDRIAKRVALISNAKKLNADGDYTGKSARDIMILAVTKVMPSANFDGKSDDYVTARFDGALETLTSTAGHVTQMNGGGTRVAPVVNADAAAAEDAAYQKANAGLNAWRNAS